MDGVVSAVFLILESGLRNDGKRKAKAGGESSAAKTGTSLARSSLPTPPAAAGAGIHGATSRAKAVGPGVAKGHCKGWLGCGWVRRFRDGGGEGRAAWPTHRAESWKHLSISRKLEKALEIFSSEFLAPHCRLRVILDFLRLAEMGSCEGSI